VVLCFGCQNVLASIALGCNLMAARFAKQELIG
jgi:hypothetical protein